MFSEKKNKYLITGKPGTGKTTAIIKMAEELKDEAAGFYTAEIREGKSRRGFEIVSLSSGKRAPLAHVDFKSSKRVGKYGVRPENLRPFLDELEEAINDRGRRLLLLDEIGKMELFSQKFKEIVLNALDSYHPLVATITARPEPFCNNLKKRPEVSLFELDYDNRDRIPDELLDQIR